MELQPAGVALRLCASSPHSLYIDMRSPLSRPDLGFPAFQVCSQWWCLQRPRQASLSLLCHQYLLTTPSILEH